MTATASPIQQPRRIVIGGCFLAFFSAAVNAGFLIQLGTSVSHLSGDVSKVAMDAVAGSSRISPAAFNLLTAIGVFLVLAHYTLVPMPILSVGFASFSCGLQNALATHYRGMVLRTTHVTGLLTDLGANLGMKLRGHQIAPWKLLVPAILVLSFFAGAVFGSLLTFEFRDFSLLIFAGLYFTGGLGWTFFKHLVLPRLPPEAP